MRASTPSSARLMPSLSRWQCRGCAGARRHPHFHARALQSPGEAAALHRGDSSRGHRPSDRRALPDPNPVAAGGRRTASRPPASPVELGLLARGGRAAERRLPSSSAGTRSPVGGSQAGDQPRLSHRRRGRADRGGSRGPRPGSTSTGSAPASTRLAWVSGPRGPTIRASACAERWMSACRRRGSYSIAGSRCPRSWASCGPHGRRRRSWLVVPTHRPSAHGRSSRPASRCCAPQEWPQSLEVLRAAGVTALLVEGGGGRRREPARGGAGRPILLDSGAALARRTRHSRGARPDVLVDRRGAPLASARAAGARQ